MYDSILHFPCTGAPLHVINSRLPTTQEINQKKCKKWISSVTPALTTPPDKELAEMLPSVLAGSFSTALLWSDLWQADRHTLQLANKWRKNMEACLLGLKSDRKCFPRAWGKISTSIFLSMFSGSDSGTNGSSLRCTHDNLQLQLLTPGSIGAICGKDECEGLLNYRVGTRSVSDDFCHSRMEMLQMFSFKNLFFSLYTFNTLIL